MGNIWVIYYVEWRGCISKMQTKRPQSSWPRSETLCRKVPGRSVLPCQSHADCIKPGRYLKVQPTLLQPGLLKGSTGMVRKARLWAEMKPRNKLCFELKPRFVNLAEICMGNHEVCEFGVEKLCSRHGCGASLMRKILGNSWLSALMYTERDLHGQLPHTFLDNKCQNPKLPSHSGAKRGQRSTLSARLFHRWLPCFWQSEWCPKSPPFWWPAGQRQLQSCQTFAHQMKDWHTVERIEGWHSSCLIETSYNKRVPIVSALLNMQGCSLRKRVFVQMVQVRQGNAASTLCCQLIIYIYIYVYYTLYII